jgi:hypothetical protein
MLGCLPSGPAHDATTGPPASVSLVTDVLHSARSISAIAHTLTHLQHCHCSLEGAPHTWARPLLLHTRLHQLLVLGCIAGLFKTLLLLLQ